ncbi:hypothetical protein PIB30_048562, partial [Stylosanthes scabra]|nr:hypothetical protein [Stylosanthes scabra]
MSSTMLPASFGADRQRPPQPSSLTGSTDSTATSRRTPVFEFPMEVPPAQPCHMPRRKRHRTLLVEGYTHRDAHLRGQCYRQEHDLPEPDMGPQHLQSRSDSNFGSLYSSPSDTSTPPPHPRVPYGALEKCSASSMKKTTWDRYSECLDLLAS